MAEEYDSDLEGEQEQIQIHDGSQSVNKQSKKRSFNEMQENDTHYNSDNHSKSKLAKLDDAANEDLDSFLNDSDDDENDETDEEQADDIVLNTESTLIQDVEFEIKDIAETYYHEIKDILAATEWDQKKLNVIQLTDIIIKQEEIGGVLMSEQSVLGFITLLSFKKHFEHLSLAHIKRFLFKRIKQPSKRKKFEYYFADKHNVGLLLHERPINVPYELVPFIYDSLFKDLQYATNKQEAKHLSDAEIELFKIDYIVMVIRYRWMPLLDEKKEKDESENHRLLPHLESRKTMELVYEHLESDLFVKKARFQFDFERNDKVWNVVVVRTSDLNDIIDAMHELFGNK